MYVIQQSSSAGTSVKCLDRVFDLAEDITVRISRDIALCFEIRSRNAKVYTGQVPVIMQMAWNLESTVCVIQQSSCAGMSVKCPDALFDLAEDITVSISRDISTIFRDLRSRWSSLDTTATGELWDAVDLVDWTGGCPVHFVYGGSRKFFIICFDLADEIYPRIFKKDVWRNVEIYAEYWEIGCFERCVNRETSSQCSHRWDSNCCCRCLVAMDSTRDHPGIRLNGVVNYAGNIFFPISATAIVIPMEVLWM